MISVMSRVVGVSFYQIGSRPDRIGVHVIIRPVARESMRALAAHVGSFQGNRVGYLALNRKIPRIHGRQDLLGGADVSAGNIAAYGGERDQAVRVDGAGLETR